MVWDIQLVLRFSRCYVKVRRGGVFLPFTCIVSSKIPKRFIMSQLVSVMCVYDTVTISARESKKICGWLLNGTRAPQILETYVFNNQQV